MWWQVIAWLQRILATTALVGLGWLLVVAVLGGFFKLDTDPLLPDTPEADWIPLPSALLLGGVILGLIVSFLMRIPLGIGPVGGHERLESRLANRLRSSPKPGLSVRSKRR